MIDLNPGPLNGFPDGIAVVNGTLYFNGFDTSDFTGSKAWRSDGTAAGTSLLVDTFPGLTGGGTFGPPLPGNFTALDGSMILFTALDPVGGLEPWKPMEPQSVARGSWICIPGRSGRSRSSLRACVMSPTSRRMIPSFTTVNGTAIYNRELFRTDGTAEGTYRVKDINPGFEPSTPTDFIRYNHFVFFSANDGLHGTELWRTDGTEAGTVQVADLNPGATRSGPQYPILARFQPHVGGSSACGSKRRAQCFDLPCGRWNAWSRTFPERRHRGRHAIVERCQPGGRLSAAWNDRIQTSCLL